ncbi:uncharacterized protein RCC_04428 [Ramularia collo-cygni]|uniref:Uncharacterized protein n=1 Tax=Ramularia collo-cygni TaxID=112498 RepID=A0A2D3V7P1_9PEZI|nr:uncharacterized protein RCC_04428 [Ramularia collo-cygni]CZT18584.1 uncharacterized protein RCC_04428 [Ramularia collo-cygni]
MSNPASSSIRISRCELARLHREPSQSSTLEDCRKRKLQETATQTPNTTGSATKKHRGRPAKATSTPSSQSSGLSGDSTPFTARPGYPLDSRGELPTPEGSPQHTPETELHDIVMVENTPVAGNMNSSNNIFDEDQSFDDTSIVPDTPLPEQPTYEGIEIQDRQSPFVRLATELENPFIGSPIESDFLRRFASISSDRESDNVHYTVRGGGDHEDRDYQAEADGLRESRSALRVNLEASTALVHTLQNRLVQNEGDTVANRALLAQAQADLIEAQERVEGVRTSMRRLGSILAIVVFGATVYVLWVWLNGPEMAYIRKRRTDLLME